MTYTDTVYGVFDGEMRCLSKLRENLDKSLEYFISELDGCKGTLIWTGVGKSGLICKKIVATMQSLGIKATFMHPVEALHGDLGFVSNKDIVIAVSNSGGTKEILDLVIPVANLGARLFSIVGKHESALEKVSEKTIVMGGIEETFLDIVPTSSTTATLVLGDAIAVSIAKQRGFDQNDFGKFHPNGQLGKRLTLRIRDIMLPNSENSIVLSGSSLEQAIFEMCRKPVGCVTIVDKDCKLMGLFTDGDLRRCMNKGVTSLNTMVIDSIMVRTPRVLYPDQLVSEAIAETISKYAVSVYPVVDKDNVVVGMLRMVDIIKTGLYP